MGLGCTKPGAVGHQARCCYSVVCVAYASSRRKGTTAPCNAL